MTIKATFTPVTLPDSLTAELRSGGWSVAVTGASGWMGQALLEALEPVFGGDFETRVAAFGSSARVLTLRSGRTVLLQPMASLGAVTPGKWLLAHCAYGTRDRVGTQGNGAFIDANQALTATVTQAVRQFRPRAILFPSSGAVYGTDGAISTDIDANPYGVLKHRDELHFMALANDIGARIAIPRVFNMAGPYINKWSAYALSDLIVQALDGRALTIQSPGPVVRSYVDVGDILALALHVLLDANAAVQIFDTRGSEDVELAELARMIETLLPGVAPSVLRTADGGQKGSVYLGQTEPMRTLCMRYGVKLMDLSTQIQRTAEDILWRRNQP